VAGSVNDGGLHKDATTQNALTLQPPHTGDAWATRVISALWDYSKAIWLERNEAYHGADKQETRLKRSNDLNDLIVQSYMLDRHHPAVTKTHLYRKTMEALLQQQPEESRQ
jgi:hypothetical protein